MNAPARNPYFLELLKAGTKNTKDVAWPGTTETVRMRVLSNADHQAAAFAAEKLFKRQEIAVSTATVDAYEDEKNTQMLYLALCTPDGQALAKDVDAFRSMMTNAEKDVLIEAYVSFEEETSPRLTRLSEAEFDSLLADVKKNPATVGSVSDTSTLRKLITSLVSPPSP